MLKNYVKIKPNSLTSVREFKRKNQYGFLIFLFGYRSIHRITIVTIVRFNNFVLVTVRDLWGREPAFSYLEADKHGSYFVLIYSFFDALCLLTCYINLL